MLPKNISLIDEIADVLDINYDAAYRRIKGKTLLTLNDGLLLSKYYHFNLNDIYIDDQIKSEDINFEKIIVQKIHLDVSSNILNLFFEKSREEIQRVLNCKNGSMYNCAKVYPLYHTDNGPFKKFRLYAFMNMINKDPAVLNEPFSKFKPSNILLEKYNSYLNKYEKVSLVEIWNDSTIDNVLNQIQYFFEVGLITKKETSLIANGLIASLKSIKEQAKNKKRTTNNNSFQLYHNNMISLLDTILMKTNTGNAVFVPYTNLAYFKVTDKSTTNQIEDYLKTNIEFSTNLSGETSVERNKFFNAMNQKIENRIFKKFL